VSATAFRTIWRAVCGLALLSAPVHADDGAAALAAGGLVFVKAPGIVMQREDLTLSAAQIRVRFEMRNDRPAQATLRVAFPLPDVPLLTPGGWETQSGASVALPGDVTDPRFIDFTVRVNGQVVQPELEVRAMLPDGHDVSALLRDAGGDALSVAAALVRSGRPDAGGAAAAAGCRCDQAGGSG
jgi:hypothetical protein